MSTKPTIYLHIGAGKTGSTTIQVWLKQVESMLLKSGYLIFDTNFKPHAHSDQLSNQQQYFHNVLESGASGISDFHAQFRSNLEYMKRKGFHSAVMSAENLINAWTGAYSWFDELIDECNWKIIAYVRNQPHYIVSAWKEWGYWRHDFEDLFNKEINADWLEALHVWEQRFGRENIYLGILEKKCLVNGLLHHDFAAAINSPDIVANDAALVYANPSMNNRSALFFSKIRQQYIQRNPKILELPPEDDKTTQEKRLQDALQLTTLLNNMFHFKPLLVGRAPISGTKEIDAPLSILNESMLQSIHMHFTESNQKLLERYRPDLDVNVAFPLVTHTNEQVISDIELVYHGFHLAFESLRSIHESIITDEKLLRNYIKNTHAVQDKLSQMQTTIDSTTELLRVINSNQQTIFNQLNQLRQQQQDQLDMVAMLNQHTTKLWNDIMVHNQSFSQIQDSIDQQDMQTTQIQSLIRDLYDRQNPIKYWTLRILHRIKVTFSTQQE